MKTQRFLLFFLFVIIASCLLFACHKNDLSFLAQMRTKDIFDLLSAKEYDAVATELNRNSPRQNEGVDVGADWERCLPDMTLPVRIDYMDVSISEDTVISKLIAEYQHGRLSLSCTYSKKLALQKIDIQQTPLYLDQELACARIEEICELLIAGNCDSESALRIPLSSCSDIRSFGIDSFQYIWDDCRAYMGDLVRINSPVSQTHLDGVSVSMECIFTNGTVCLDGIFDKEIELEQLHIKQGSYHYDQDAVFTAAEEIYQSLVRGNYGEIHQRMSSQLREEYSVDQIVELWKSVLEEGGKLVAPPEFELVSEPTERPVVLGRVEFQNSTFTLRFSFNTEIQLIDFYLGHGGAEKPVIYLYPETEQEVDVHLEIDGEFAFTYPAYRDGWHVVARPDGTLLHQGKEYSYLFWEADYLNCIPDFTHGFVVRREDTVSFLQTTLASIGLTPREYNEFIVYWAPKLMANPCNKITFVQKQYTDAAKLTISPEPDSILRVFMAYAPAPPDLQLKPQTFYPFVRKGFTVVEWGGGAWEQ